MTLSNLFQYIDLFQSSLWLSVASIILMPSLWNFAGQTEYHTRWITKLCGGTRPGVKVIGSLIFTLSMARNILFKHAISTNPVIELNSSLSVLFSLFGAALMIAGFIFVVGSSHQLGFEGTYLGDYFGILMSEKVTAFPFNVLEHPMYVGSTMIFVGAAFWYVSPAGFLLASVVWITYAIASKYEGEFTKYIYDQKDKSESNGNGNGLAARKTKTNRSVGQRG